MLGERRATRVRGASSRRPCRERLGSPQIGSCLLFPERTTGHSPPFPRERRPAVAQLPPAPRQCRLQGGPTPSHRPGIPPIRDSVPPHGSVGPVGPSGAHRAAVQRGTRGGQVPPRRLPCEARRAGGAPDSNRARLRAARPGDGDGIAWSGLPRVPASFRDPASRGVGSPLRCRTGDRPRGPRPPRPSGRFRNRTRNLGRVDRALRRFDWSDQAV